AFGDRLRGFDAEKVVRLRWADARQRSPARDRQRAGTMRFDEKLVGANDLAAERGRVSSKDVAASIFHSVKSRRVFHRASTLKRYSSFVKSALPTFCVARV